MANAMANDRLDWLRQMREAKVSRKPERVVVTPLPVKAIPEAEEAPSSTYRYRDVEKRRAYMRDLMARKRKPLR